MIFLKKIFAILLTCCLCCGFMFQKKENSYIIFSDHQIDNIKSQDIKNNFKLGSKVYYLVHNPLGFKDDLLRIQLIKKDTKVDDLGGYTIKMTFDKEVKKGTTDFVEVFFLYEIGTYIIRIVEFTHPTQPVAVGVFKIE